MMTCELTETIKEIIKEDSTISDYCDIVVLNPETGSYESVDSVRFDDEHGFVIEL